MDSLDTRKAVFTTRRLFTVSLITFGYLLLSYWLIGFRMDQVYLVTLFVGAYFASSISRKFIIGFSIFIVYWIIFDYMKAFPNYLFREVNLESLYQTEKNIFGIHQGGRWLTPNEYWLFHHTTFLDILTGLFYLSWVPVPLAFAAFLFFRSRTEFLYFSLTFLLVNLIGFVIYYLYPAAPPWYIQQHGFTFISSTPGNTGGLERFDLFFHSSIFHGLYSKSSNVFAAMPSLHSSYPVIVLYYGLKNKLGRINLFFGMVMLGIWFSAIYNSHHYVLDVLAGISCAVTGIYLFEWLKEKKATKSFLQMFVRAIS
ncbi:MAG: inositol phosphorylceramide synthase [Bacteroidota bacterium]|nr:inositol phosphorylceramide synthase [Bacteroidota bacterium]